MGFWVAALLPGLSWVSEAGHIDPSARSLRSLGRDDKLGVASGPQDVIPSEAGGRVEESMEWPEAPGLLPIRLYRGEQRDLHGSLRSGPLALKMSFRARPKAESRNLWGGQKRLASLPVRFCRGEQRGPHRSLHSGPLALGRDDRIEGPAGPSVGMTRWGRVASSVGMTGRGLFYPLSRPHSRRTAEASPPPCHSERGRRPSRGIYGVAVSRLRR
jgi:hypothetical protein